MLDPTYDMNEIKANPVWYLAWVISEIQNDAAPIGWSKYTWVAEALLSTFNITPK